MEADLAKNAFLAAGNVQYLSNKLGQSPSTVYANMLNIVASTPTQGLSTHRISTLYNSLITKTSSYAAPYSFTYRGGPLLTTPVKFFPIFCGSWNNSGPVTDSPITIFNRNIYMTPSDQLIIQDSQSISQRDVFQRCNGSYIIY
jgi:hypothetical protein